MWTRELLKENGKIAFQRNYWLCVVVSLILGFIGGGAGGINLNYHFNEMSTTDGTAAIYSFDNLGYLLLMVPLMLISMVLVVAIAFAVSAFLVNIVRIGGCRFFMENREHKTDVGQVFFAFGNGNYMNCVKTMFWRDLCLVGWTLLFIVPGIIKGYAYRMIPYIMAENPGISRQRAFAISEQMMDGHKMEAFVLDLSFIGWDFLSAVTAGIVGIFYVNPYKNATFTELYTAVKSEAFARGITDVTELPGVRTEDER